MASTVQRNQLVSPFSVRDNVLEKGGKLQVTHQKWFTQAQQAMNGSAQVTAVIPAHSGALGEPGTFAFDAHWLYVCVGLNTWLRTPLTGF